MPGVEFDEHVRSLRARLADSLGERAIRLVPSRRAVAGVALVAMVVGGFTGWRLLVGRPRSTPVSASGPTGAIGTPLAGGTGTKVSMGTTPSRTTSAGQVVVDVVGKVRHPGLIRLPTGARVDDAIRAAGGALPGTDLSGVNLARVLVDGEQIAVGTSGVAPPSGPTGGSGASAGALINLNSATAEQLDALPGVGPVLAQRIVDWRTQHGRFDSIDQLRDVPGIGDAKFAEIRALVTI